MLNILDVEVKATFMNKCTIIGNMNFESTSYKPKYNLVIIYNGVPIFDIYKRPEFLKTFMKELEELLTI